METNQAAALGLLVAAMVLGLSVFALVPEQNNNPVVPISGPIQLTNNVVLMYADGSSVILPIGNYTTIILSENIWYVDNHVYP